MRQFIAITVGVSTLAIATAAMAQEAPVEEGATSGNEIVVQARRRDESVQDVPLVVQAVTAENLEKLQIRQFEDVARLVPGLQLSASNTGTGTTTSIRGINFDTLASGAATTVEFYRNDAVVVAGALFQSVYDVGQIEVLRGPQGTLRGRASPSGSITVTTRRPDLDEAGGYLIASAAEGDKWNGNAAVNVPIIAGKLGIRVAGFVGENRGNDIRGINTVTGAIDSAIYDKSRAFRVSARAMPFDDVLTLDFNYESIKHKSRGYDQVESRNLVTTSPASPITIEADDRLGANALARFADQTFKLFNWQGQLRVLGQRLTYVGGTVKQDLRAITPQDFSGLFGTTGSRVAPSVPFATQQNTGGSQTSHELRLQSDERIAGMLDYVVGAMQVTGTSPTLQFVPGSAAAQGTTLFNFALTGRYRYRADRERSIFGNATVHLGDDTELSGGVRRIWFKADSGLKASANITTDPLTWTDSASVRRCFGHPEVVGCKPTKTATIYSATAKHNFTRDLMVYASYGTSWRPGNSVVGFNGQTVSPFLNQFLNLPDENSKSYEIGLKSSWLDQRLRFNISGFYQKFTNYAYRISTPVIAIATSPTLTPATPAVTAASAFNFVAPVPADVKGFEAELAFDPSSRFSLMANVAFADGKIKNGLFPCYDLDNNNVADAVAPTAAALFAQVGDSQIDTCRANVSSSSAPRWSGTAQAEYRHPLGRFGEGFLRGFVNWKGDSAGDGINPLDQVKAFATFDLFAGIRGSDGAWELTGYVRNVTNTRRVLTRTASAQLTTLVANQNLVPFGGTGTSIASSSATNYLLISTIAPREAGITLRFALGSR